MVLENEKNTYLNVIYVQKFQLAILIGIDIFVSLSHQCVRHGVDNGARVVYVQKRGIL